MFKAFATGGILLGIGIALYPHLITIIDELYSVAEDLLPAMDDWGHLFFRIIPLLLIYLVIGGAIYKIIGKFTSKGDND